MLRMRGEEFGNPREESMTFLNLSFGTPVVRARETITGENLSFGTPVVRARETITGEMGVVGARFIMAGGPSEGRFSLVEHPIVPRGLWGFQLGTDVVYAEPGDLVYKPRDIWHTFWNATDELARLLEIISPAGFEQLFVELSDLLRTDPDNVEATAALGPRYGVESDPEATRRVVAEHGLIERPE
jgi:hypothetical protein